MLGRSHLVRLFLVGGPLSVGVPLLRLFSHSRFKINLEPVPSLLTISALFLGIKILFFFALDPLHADVERFLSCWDPSPTIPVSG